MNAKRGLGISTLLELKLLEVGEGDHVNEQHSECVMKQDDFIRYRRVQTAKAGQEKYWNSQWRNSKAADKDKHSAGNGENDGLDFCWHL